MQSASPIARQPPAAAPLLPLVGAVAAGILADRLGPQWWGCGGWWIAAFVALIAWWLLTVRERFAASSVCLLAAIIALAAGWHHWHWQLFAADDVGRLANRQSYPCCLEAVAQAGAQRMAAPPNSPYRAIPQGEKSQLPLAITRVRSGDRWLPASGQCELIVDGHLQGIGAGDRIRVFGQFRRPPPARNPGQFDYAEHLRADRQLCLVRSESPDCVTLLEQGSVFGPLRHIDRLRNHWQRTLWRTLGERHAPVATAILLGTRNSMPRPMVDAYRVTGAVHVLVVSGLHAGILIGIVWTLLAMGWLPDRWAIPLAMALVAAYATLTGGHPPVLRAAILAELFCLARLLNVPWQRPNALAAAALVVLALNPSDLYRTGPQLSFLCVAVLFWFATVRWRRERTPLERLLHTARPAYQRSTLAVGQYFGLATAATLAVWLASLPLIMQQYHLASPVAVLASVPVTLALALSLASGFALLVGGTLCPPLEGYLAGACGNCIGLLEGIVHHTSDLPAAYDWTPAPYVWWVIGWYLLVVVLLARGGTRWGWQRTVQLAVVWVVIGAVPALASRRPTGEFEAAFLDVGHGVCVVMTTPDGATMLYDAGSLGSPEYAADTIAGYLWSRGIRRIDGIVLSHADVDHFNAVPGLVDRFEIGRVFVSQVMFRPGDDPADRSAPAELRRLLQARGVPIETIQLGDRLTLDSVTQATVLWPDRLGSFGSDNSNSVVLAVESPGLRLLLPGDLEAPGLEWVMDDQPYHCDVLLAPHHGSRRSDPPGFAAWSRPQQVVVSGGTTAVDRNTAGSYQAAGAELWTTTRHGTISVRSGPSGPRIATFLE